MQEQQRESSDFSTYLAAVLLLASMAMVFSTMYASDILAINYGVGAGAIIQSKADNAQVAQILNATVTELTSLHRALREAFVLMLVGIIAVFFASAIYLFRSKRQYAAIHLVTSIVFGLLWYILFSYFATNFAVDLFVYLAIAVAIAIDAYFFKTKTKRTQQSRSLEIVPGMPFGNLLRLKDEIFSKLGSQVSIVDKHFNSVALENLYRLIADSNSIKEINIVTSSEYFDSSFGTNLANLKKELSGRGVQLNLYVMSEEDATKQHERFMFDELNAYKMPPFNIINEKSEHIVHLKLSEARARFKELMKNSIKYENYLLKKAHESNQNQ